MLEKRHYLLDTLFHAIKLVEDFIALHNFVGKNSAESGVLRSIDHLWLTNRHEHTLSSGGVNAGIFFTEFEILLNRQFFLLGSFKTLAVMTENTHNLPRVSD